MGGIRTIQGRPGDAAPAGDRSNLALPWPAGRRAERCPESVEDPKDDLPDKGRSSGIPSRFDEGLLVEGGDTARRREQLQEGKARAGDAWVILIARSAGPKANGPAQPLPS